MKVLLILAVNSWKTEIQKFPVVRYFTWNLELVWNILWVIVGQEEIKTDNGLKLFELNCLQFCSFANRTIRFNNLWNICKTKSGKFISVCVCVDVCVCVCVCVCVSGGREGRGFQITKGWCPKINKWGKGDCYLELESTSQYLRYGNSLLLS